ncbi:hypothetical protein CLF_106416 [Clonorchis sinensis]|uniref:Uncharacterized protein n=1 Tax=Clonorchis sinensis TaxID=79923 RepID=G7YPX3_CLOSI|nr:hypothetical protein CLF_106416 [Clonorchis sinensis]
MWNLSSGLLIRCDEQDRHVQFETYMAELEGQDTPDNELENVVPPCGIEYPANANDTVLSLIDHPLLTNYLEHNIAVINRVALLAAYSRAGPAPRTDDSVRLESVSRAASARHMAPTSSGEVEPWMVNVEPPTALEFYDCICSPKRHRACGAFDSVDRSILLDTLVRQGMPRMFVSTILPLYSQTSGRVRVYDELSKSSPCDENLVDLEYVDDIALIFEEEEKVRNTQRKPVTCKRLVNFSGCRKIRGSRYSTAGPKYLEANLPCSWRVARGFVKLGQTPNPFQLIILHLQNILKLLIVVIVCGIESEIATFIIAEDEQNVGLLD